MPADKIVELFREFVGDRADKLRDTPQPIDIRDRITAALVDDPGYSDTQEVISRDEIGFHLLDWRHDAAFLVALVLFPERFSDNEIREGVDSFLIHVPAHVLEAARLGGYETTNIFAEPDGSV